MAATGIMKFLPGPIVICSLISVEKTSASSPIMLISETSITPKLGPLGFDNCTLIWVESPFRSKVPKSSKSVFAVMTPSLSSVIKK